MRAAVAMLAAAALVAAAPSAEGKRKRSVRGTVTDARGKAPKAWRSPTRVPVVPTPTPASTPSPTAAPVASPTATPGSTLPPANPRSVSVRSTEYAFTLSQTTVDAGTVRVQFDNSRAEDPHELSVDQLRFGEVAAGDVVTYSIDLVAGRHVLVCPLPGHEELGMRAVLTVR